MEYINNGTLIDSKELLFNELYEKTKDCGRVQFINLLIAKERDNQELKKQLENCYCNRTDCVGRIKDSKLYDSLVQKIENQQQEFIEWLEKEIEAIENKLNRYNELAKQGKETDFEYYESIIDERKFDIYMKTLRKYKEIVGDIYESDISS